MIDLVIDPGHGGSDYGCTGENHVIEKDCTLYISNKVKEYLEKKKLLVILTRYDDRYVTLEERSKIANRNKAKYFISIHINSAEIDSAEGIELYTFSKGDEGEELAENILDSVVSGMRLKNRGVKFANFTVLKETEMPAILIETCFISNLKEAVLLNEQNFKDKIALFIANGFLKHIGQEEIAIAAENININSKIPIVSLPTATKKQAFQWAKTNGATEEFIALAEGYWNIATLISGVNPVVAYAQSALETNFGSYNEGLKKECKNPGGFKIININDENINGYVKFDNWTSGIEAHLDHLGLYSGVNIYPKKITKDPKHFAYLLGKVKYVEDLSGNWSSSENYGERIVNFIKDIESTLVNEEIKPINLDESYSEDEQTHNSETGIEGLKEEIKSLVKDIENIKNRTNELKAYVNSIEVFLSQEKKLKEALNETNISLQEKNRNYEQTIEEILNIISKIRNII